MQSITQWLKESRYTAPLSPGCKQCARGSKLVVLITGLCPAHCFYCPLSFAKGGNDEIYADEWQLSSENDTDILIKEARLINAEGAGMTGGDPLAVWKRTKRYVTILKDQFGDDFHIHLYTSGLTNVDHITEVIQSGVDEIRFHPTPKTWKQMEKSPIKKAIKIALTTNAEVAIEIPCIPKMDQDINALITWAEQKHIDYVNINELEFSERNESMLYQQGFLPKSDVSAAVTQSQETAYNIITLLSKKDLEIGIHYCSASFKDAIQLTNRMKRRATQIAQPYDEITPEGTIIKGIIEPINRNDAERIKSFLISQHVNQNQYHYNIQKKRIEIQPDILKQYTKTITSLGFSCYCIELYPTADALEVERIPIK